MFDFTSAWNIVVSFAASLAVIIGLFSNLKKVITELKKPLTGLECKIDNLSSNISELKKHDDVIDKSILAMQRHDILEACEKALKLGYATMEQKQTITWQYESYKALGGNSFVGSMVAQVEQLPLSKPARRKTTKQ